MPFTVSYVDNDGTIDITDRVQVLGESPISVALNAEEGSVAMSRMFIDDPDGDLIVKGHHLIKVLETDADPDEQVIGVFNIGPKDVGRGGRYSEGVGRVWEVTLADVNNHIERRIEVGTDTKRPAETDVERIQWLLSSAELGLVTDELYVDTTDGVAMDAADYLGQSVKSVLDDCAQASGRNYFIWFNEAEDAYSLWYKHAHAEEWDSPLRISNVAGDEDDDTFAPSDDDKLTRDPGRQVSGVYLPYDGGYAYVQNLVTADEINMRRDASAPSVNVKTAAKATARANRYLAENDEEDDRITAKIVVPAAKVNQAHAGMRIQARFQHLPGYEDFTWCRILTRQVTQVSMATYSIEMTLSPAVAPATPGIDQHTTDVSLGTRLNVTWPDGDVLVDALLIGFLAIRANADADLSDTVPDSYVGPDPSDIIVASTDWTHEATAYARAGNEYGMVMASRVATADDTRYPRWTALGGSARPRAHHVAVSGLAGTTDTPVTASNQSTSGSVFTSPDVTVGGSGYIFAGFSYSAAGPGDGSSAPFVMEPDAPAVTLSRGYAVGSFAPYSWFGYRRVEAAGTYSIVLNRSAVPRNPTYGFGWILVFCPD